MTHSNPEQILSSEGIAQNKEKFFTNQIKKYEGSIFIFLSKILNNKSYVPDVLQNTFLKAWEMFDNYESSKGVFSTWLFKIASNCALDHIRHMNRKKNRLLISLDSVLDLNGDNKEELSKHDILPSHNLTPLELFLKHEKKIIGENALNRLESNLNETEKKVYELRIKEEMSYEDISKNLDIPINTVRKIIYDIHHYRLTKKKFYEIKRRGGKRIGLERNDINKLYLAYLKIDGLDYDFFMNTVIEISAHYFKFKIDKENHVKMIKSIRYQGEMRSERVLIAEKMFSALGFKCRLTDSRKSYSVYFDSSKLDIEYLSFEEFEKVVTKK
jgi:RNA polymerase sigma factor (sigma-70 family)